MKDILYINFPSSGVTTWIFIPPLIAFTISLLTSMGGVSGAFLLLPIQMNFLGYTIPSVSATNQLFNVIAIPSGVWQYVRERRMIWPLAWTVVLGTLPGVFIGAWIRIQYLPDPINFRFFTGIVLAFIGIRLIQDIATTRIRPTNKIAERRSSVFEISQVDFTIKKCGFLFNGEIFSFSVPSVFFLCLVVGVIGGIYGIGGGSIIAPFFVMFFHLPIHAVAGAALLGTLVTSIAGVFIYQVLASLYTSTLIAPDWPLGFLFGVGGFGGMYLGARLQKLIPAIYIKSILCFCILCIAIQYIHQFFNQ